MHDFFEILFDDPFYTSVTGFVLWFAFVCWKDTAKSPETVMEWCRANWLQFVIAMFLAGLMVAKDDDIMEEFFNSGKVWPWYYYLCGPVIINMLYQVFALVPKISLYFVKKFSPIK
jgi:hypothetical protein